MKQSNISISLGFISFIITIIFLYASILTFVQSTQSYIGQDDNQVYSFQFSFIFISSILLLIALFFLNSIFFLFSLYTKQYNREQKQAKDKYFKNMIEELKYNKLEEDLKTTNIIENKETIIEQFYNNKITTKLKELKSSLPDSISKIFEDTKKDLEKEADNPIGQYQNWHKNA